MYAFEFQDGDVLLTPSGEVRLLKQLDYSTWEVYFIDQDEEGTYHFEEYAYKCVEVKG